MRAEAAARVVDQHIETSSAIGERGDRGMHAGPVGHVRRQRDVFTARHLGELGRDGLRRRGVDIEHSHERSLTGQAAAQRRAEIRSSAAGNQHGAPGQVEQLRERTGPPGAGDTLEAEVPAYLGRQGGDGFTDGLHLSMITIIIVVRQ